MTGPVPAAAAPEAPVRDTTRPLPFLQAARSVFDLALEGMLWSRRSLVMAIMVGLPILFAVLYRVVLVSRMPPRMGGFAFYGLIVRYYYVWKVLPLVALFYATSLIADEVEGRTLTYLLTRPVRRGSILAGKFAAYVVTTLSLSLPPVLITFFLLTTAGGFSGIGQSIPDLFRDLGVVALTVLSYGALFTLLGVLLKRPMIPGLLFIFVWEWLAHLPGYLPRLTLTAHLQSLITHRTPLEGEMDLFGQVFPAVQCLSTLGALTVMFFFAAAWIFSRREYVMDQ
jgi:ABC-2 type transport system permease protein